MVLIGNSLIPWRTYSMSFTGAVAGSVSSNGLLLGEDGTGELAMLNGSSVSISGIVRNFSLHPGIGSNFWESLILLLSNSSNFLYAKKNLTKRKLFACIGGIRYAIYITRISTQ